MSFNAISLADVFQFLSDVMAMMTAEIYLTNEIARLIV